MSEPDIRYRPPGHPPGTDVTALELVDLHPLVIANDGTVAQVSGYISGPVFVLRKLDGTTTVVPCNRLVFADVSALSEALASQFEDRHVWVP